MRHGGLFGSVIFAGLVLTAAASSPCYAQQWTGYVSAPDGVQMATDVYFPEGSGPWPVVLTRTPYNKQDAGHYPLWCQTLTQHGYACVAQDCRGRFESGGIDTVFRDDGRDGRATLEWIAEQDWCNGSIASVGGSAMGLTGYAMAPSAPPELKCMVAAVATPDIYEHIFSHGGSVRWELAYNWLVGQGSLDIYDEFVSHRLRDRLVAGLPLVGSPETVNVKTLHFGGWWDLYIQGPLDSFRAYHHHGGDGAAGNQYIIMGPWHHFTLDADWLAQTFDGDRITGDLRFPDNAFPGGWPFAEDGWQLLFDWLGYCLKDEPTGVCFVAPCPGLPDGRCQRAGCPGQPLARSRRLAAGNGRGALLPGRTGRADPSRLRPPSDDPRDRPEDPVPTLGGANHFPEIEVDGRADGHRPPRSTGCRGP